MDYNYLFSGKNPAIQSFFRAETKENPAISTSYLAEKAMQYMAGVRFPAKKGLRLNPHYRRSTKKPKHPYLGYTDVYVFSPHYFWQHGHYILDLTRRGLINISHVFQFEAEILFESDIPGRYHYYRDIFHMPDFSQAWSAALEADFGYSKSLWTRHRNELAKLVTNDAYNNWVGRVMERVIKHRAFMLTTLLKYLLAKEVEQRFPVVPYSEDCVVSDASTISPQHKNKWKKIDPSTPDVPFYQRMADLSLNDSTTALTTTNVAAGLRLPSFDLPASQWNHNRVNQVPDAIVSTGIRDGMIIVVNNIQYVIIKTKGTKEPTAQNSRGEIFIAKPRLQGG